MKHHLPAQAGVGLKPEHVTEILASSPALGFFEIHAENYMVAGGRFHHDLSAIRERYALSVHGVGLSIGGQAPLDGAHLQRLKQLLERYQAEAFSEHLAWSSHGGHFYNDLLPVAYTHQSLQRVCEHIDQVQNVLARPMMLENPSTYLQWAYNDMDECSFLREVLQRTGCGLLLDVTNLYVSCTNHGRDPWLDLQTLPLDRVGEIHLAGFAEEVDAAGDRLLIDHHGAAVCQQVWALYDAALQHIGHPVATLIERDNHIPSWSVLLSEAQQAQALLQAMGRMLA
jgi:uncharacterized protein (UPF0276 family)